jgi:hypothetical protein
MDTATLLDAYSVDEFARRHGIGRTTAYEEIKSGRLVDRKVHGRTIITAEDARSWRTNLPRVDSAAACCNAEPAA